MKIRLTDPGKRYILSQFPNLQLLKDVLTKVSQIQGVFDKSTLRQMFPSLNSCQLQIVVDLIATSFDAEDSQGTNTAVTLVADGYEIQSLDHYNMVTGKILDRLECKQAHIPIILQQTNDVALGQQMQQSV